MYLPHSTEPILSFHVSEIYFQFVAMMQFQVKLIDTITHLSQMARKIHLNARKGRDETTNVFGNSITSLVYCYWSRFIRRFSTAEFPNTDFNHVLS